VLPGELEALEALIRHDPAREIQQRTRVVLREWAVENFMNPRHPPKLAALQALQMTRDDDITTVIKAAAYRCSFYGLYETPADCGWPIRRIAVQMMNPTNAQFSTPLSEALHDPAFQVRLEALRVWAAAVPRTLSCRPLVEAFADAMPMVAMQAVDLLTVRCPERDEIVAALQRFVEDLSDANKSGEALVVPAHALVKLALFDPAGAQKTANTVAASHDAWRVRAAAARTALILSDEALAVRLAGDADANVRLDALDALSSMKSAELIPQALGALKTGDDQLVRLAATHVAKASRRDDVLDGLTKAFIRVSAEGRDPSRDTRVAVLKAVQDLGIVDSDLATPFEPYLRDFDPVVAGAVANAMCALLGVTPQPGPPQPGVPRAMPEARPDPDAPTLDEFITFLAIPTERRYATVVMQNGDQIRLDLDFDAAPLTAYRFVKRAREGYYDGTTFHRVVPNNYIQGGSPGANEYAGDKYFMRDEISVTSLRARHTPGAVGISTRGRDTGDAQIFVDTTHLPRLNRDYTVFAMVHDYVGMQVVYRILEGAKIDTIRLPVGR
jgi:cyclophilin family peptidyl-prolyl cis-trans isomerase/HEAT repeat protein